MKWPTMVCASLLVLCGAALAQDSLTAEDLVAKHLAAFGTPEARAAARSRGVDGTAHFEVVLGASAQADGVARMGSDGHKVRCVISLNGITYIGEDFLTDGSKVQIASPVASKRSLLFRFFLARDTLLSEGLFGGVLSTAWPLLDLDHHAAKLRYTGLKKVDGRELHELRYEPKKIAADTQVKLYFDPQTFRHVMTIYEAMIAVAEAQSLSPSATTQRGASTQESRQTIKETFDDFRTLDGLQLPAHWTIESTNDGNGTSRMKWDIKVENAQHTGIDPGVFRVR